MSAELKSGGWGTRRPVKRDSDTAYAEAYDQAPTPHHRDDTELAVSISLLLAELHGRPGAPSRRVQVIDHFLSQARAMLLNGHP